MLFYKVLILFWGCTRTCSHAWWFKKRGLHYLLQYLSPQPHTNGSIISGFWWRPAFRKTKCVVIGLLFQFVVIGEQLRRYFRRKINSLPAGGAVGVGESEVSPVTLCTQNRAPLTKAALSDIICKMKWKWHPKFSENSWFPSEIQWYKNTRRGGFTICDVTNTGKQLCSPNEPFAVVLEKGYN